MIWVRLLTIAIALCLVSPTASVAKTQGRYASIIVDADSLDVLHARQIDAQRHPASLTKIMTLYLTFEAMERGDITLSSSVVTSAHAARTPAVKMGLKRGQSVTIDTLIQAVAVRSSNDAAVVLAEAIAGSEGAFVTRMNETAASLGMRQTVFRNPHGLPDDMQVTTARDMAKLALATLTRYPQHYHYFGQTHFRGRKSTNKLLSERDDVDGFKTGYTRASGYNLVISATRDDHRIIAVVLGGASSGSRNSHMSDLIDRGFEVMDSVASPVIAARAPTVQTPVNRNWALQIDGFDSPAETAIFADALIRYAGTGEVGMRSVSINDRAYHSVRVEALDNRTARSLCADHPKILQIAARQCKVLSIINPG
ncbi:D-alanyl-D-alanine carboxypeptidase family protein [Algimonas ampicilliniresistens]|uniref:D-alanyl-D-alanine carboxypeptidase family protein n=1 Tax=Algimonas ampicilliniresistens TaxID=1298735 RepID=UPI0024E0D901|nr:D-alanyl-D-alanine carboxypeptidase family protein [Algimonas ampicilliniresistens]